RGAGNTCGLVGARAQWAWASQLGCTLRRMSRGTARYDAPCAVIWVQPAFGRMSANQFAACAQAIELGAEAMRQAAPLLQVELERRRQTLGPTATGGPTT